MLTPPVFLRPSLDPVHLEDEAKGSNASSAGAKNGTEEGSAWHRHRTMSGIVIALLVILSFIAAVVVVKFAWRKVGPSKLVSWKSWAGG